MYPSKEACSTFTACLLENWNESWINIGSFLGFFFPIVVTAIVIGFFVLAIGIIIDNL